jgi:hypothetical protein
MQPSSSYDPYDSYALCRSAAELRQTFELLTPP